MFGGGVTDGWTEKTDCKIQIRRKATFYHTLTKPHSMKGGKSVYILKDASCLGLGFLGKPFYQYVLVGVV